MKIDLEWEEIVERRDVPALRALLANPARWRRLRSSLHPRTPLIDLLDCDPPAEFTALLLRAGEPVNERDGDGRVALDYALRILGASNRTTSVMLLLDHSADVNAPCFDAWTGAVDTTPLHIAVAGRYRALVPELLARGADPDARQQFQGWTPLHLATMDNNPGLTKLLLGAGADPNVADRVGLTPLMLAAGAQAEFPGCDAEEDVTARLAPENRKPSMVTLLLAAGADRDAVDDRGRRALDFAEAAHHARIVKRLNKGAP